jgi:hypothetical protein
MSGTRKMEKFEVDAYAKARAEGRGDAATALEDQAAAAIADLQPASALEGLEREGPVTDLPTRPFAPRAGADLPALAFEPRAGADLPALAFEPRAGADLPALAFEPRAGADLPALAFEPRAGADLPALAFDPRTVDTLPPPSAPPEDVAPLQQPTTPGAFSPGEWIPPQQTPASQPRVASSEGEPQVDALRTKLAQKFVTLADSVTEAFGDFSIGAAAYAVELTAPQGMSTGGGKQALQHLRLRPRREGYSALVAGTVNQVERRAELRDFDHVAITHEVRFRQPLDIKNQEWEQFLRKAEVVLNDAGIQSMRTPPPRELLEQRRSMARVSKGAIAALIVVLLLAGLVLWRVAVALMAS